MSDWFGWSMVESYTNFRSGGYVPFCVLLPYEYVVFNGQTESGKMKSRANIQ